MDSTQPVMQLRSYMSIPFEDKEEAKKLGAKWDAENRLWYAPNDSVKLSLNKFWFMHVSDEEKTPTVSIESDKRDQSVVIAPPPPSPDLLSTRRKPKLDSSRSRPAPYRQRGGWFGNGQSRYPPIPTPQWAIDAMGRGEVVMSTSWDTRGD